jgi:hexosaminidase
MTKSIVALFLIFLCTGFSLTESDPTEVSIVPKPVLVRQLKGSLDLKKRGVVELSGANVSLASLVDDFLNTKKIPSTPKGFPIKLTIGQDKSLGAEGYHLVISKNGIFIDSPTEAGLFYGIQSLIQITPLSGTTVPFVK